MMDCERPWIFHQYMPEREREIIGGIAMLKGYHLKISSCTLYKLLEDKVMCCYM